MIQDGATKTLLLGAIIIVGVLIGQVIVSAPDDVVAFMTFGAVWLGVLAFVARAKEDRRYIVRIWLIALSARALVACISYYSDIREGIAPDYDTYDVFGYQFYQSLTGELEGADYLSRFTSFRRSGWGIYYFVAGVYLLIGRNAFAFQLICCVLGATCAVLLYHIAYRIYPQQKVARMVGMVAALSPSMIIWTSQGIKEGPITFLLCACLLLTLRMSQRIKLLDAVLLLASLFCLYSLRHYVFFVVFFAILASLIIAAREFSPLRIIQGGVMALLLSAAFLSLGADDVVESQLDLKRIQAGRTWSARVSGSGYGGDVDITDTREAITYLPVGTLYFLYAPFPWMIRSLTQLLTLPELIIWWLSAPFLFYGYWHALRHRLRESFAICLFTIGLTLVYALYQTNAGTAHRMRVQLLGFFIIFVAIGWERWRSLKAERRRMVRFAVYGRPAPTAISAMKDQTVR